MLFKNTPVRGTLVSRYKRFLADVRLESGPTVTAHCANTGSMLQVSEPGSPVMLTAADNPARSTRWDWQATMVNGLWAGINTSTPNILVREGFETGAIPEFAGYDSIRAEVPFGNGSRIDAVLSGPGGDFHVEAKNVTLVVDGRALFPDAMTARGSKHLDELARLARSGRRSAMFYLVQRMDADSAGPAAHIDPVYRDRLVRAVSEGVEIIAWRARTTPEGVFLDRPLPFVMDG